jgi:hypothetical protein
MIVDAVAVVVVWAQNIVPAGILGVHENKNCDVVVCDPHSHTHKVEKKTMTRRGIVRMRVCFVHEKSTGFGVRGSYAVVAVVVVVVGSS